jgi:hypothetical protein
VGQITPGAVDSCSTNVVFQETLTSGASYILPSPGVITSWQTKSNGTPGQVRLKVFHLVTGTQFKVTGQSNLQTPAANSVNSFPTQIPVLSGDRIGGFFTGGAACNFVAPSPDSHHYSSIVGDPPPGDTNDYPNLQGGVRTNIAAQLEADADHDGFGDESQDGCPANGSTHAACFVTSPSVSGTTEVGQTLTATPGTAPGNNNPSFQWLRGSGNTFTPIAGATGTSYRLTSADRGKRIKLTQNLANPAGPASATTNPTAVIGPPLVTASAKKTQRVVLQRAVFIKVKLSLAAKFTATGTIALPKSAAKTLRFKRVTRSLPAGTSKTLKLRLSNKDLGTLRRALRPPHRLKAKLVLTAKDQLGGKATKKLTITLKR